jgi:hypothetical protein
MERTTAAGSIKNHGVWPWLMALTGTLISYRDVLLSGFRRAAGDVGDARLVNYALERSYLWIQNIPGHSSFWDPPHFYPTQNVTAYTDSLLTVAPLYWALRVFGFAPDTASQVWALLLLLIGFASFYYLLAYNFSFDRMSSAFGAALFAFASARIAQLNHPQLLSHVFSVIAIVALTRLFQVNISAAPWRARGALAVAAAAAVGQIYASFYLGWFLFVGLGAATLVAFAVRPWRVRLLSVWTAQWRWVVVCSTFSIALLIPLLRHAAAAASTVQTQGFIAIEPMVPGVAAWTYLGPESWWYGWLADVRPWTSLTDSGYQHELQLGLGFITTAIVVVGLWIGRRNTKIALIGLAAAVVAISVTRLSDSIVPWRMLLHLVPGAFAIRAVSRIALLLLIPAGIGVACFLSRQRAAAALFFGIVCMGEQVRHLQSFDKLAIRADVAAVTAAVDPTRCGFFYLSPREPAAHLNWKSQLDAMWASLETGVPTINGYSGYLPPRWGQRLWDNAIYTAKDEKELERELEAWMAQAKLNSDMLCWLRPSRRPGHAVRGDPTAAR